MKEFFFITKECGLSDAFFYILYKIRLKIQLTNFCINNDLKRTARIEKIYEAIYFKESLFTENDGKRYIRKYLNSPQNRFVKLRPYTSDSKVFQQVFQQEQYRSVVEIYKQLFDCNPKIIFDCGANIGLTSIFLSSFFPDASYTLIEPFKENAEMITLNLEINKIKKYILLEGGIWNKSSTLSINRDFGDGKEWAISLAESSSSLNNIKGYSLVELVRAVSCEIDILKIDVEGAEKVLFEDINYAAQFLEKVKCIAIEIHDELDLRTKIYNAFTVNNYFYYNSGELTIAINRSFMK